MTQTEQIKEYLFSGKKLTPLEALNLFGCFRLGARIWDIKKEGFMVKSEMIDIGGKQVAQYSIETKPDYSLPPSNDSDDGRYGVYEE